MSRRSVDRPKVFEGEYYVLDTSEKPAVLRFKETCKEINFATGEMIDKDSELPNEVRIFLTQNKCDFGDGCSSKNGGQIS